MRTIAIEAVGINRYGGARVSILNLLTSVCAVDRATRYLVLLSEEEPALRPFPNVEQIVVPQPNRFAVRLALQAQLPGLVRRARVDLVHFTKSLGAFGLGCPSIITVHDLTSLLLKKQHSPAAVLYWRTVQPLTLRRAAKVVTVSHDAGRDVERVFGVPREKIVVVYWAPDARFDRASARGRVATARQEYRLPDRYILFLGILAKKKNLPTLLRALALLRERLPVAPDLVVAGRRYPQSDDIESVPLTQQLGLAEHVHFIGGVPDEVVPALYAGSELYILPSLHEGFGIPLLEAMACGVPVITTRAGALPEIAGDAALLLDDPFDAAGMADAIERVLTDVNMRAELVRRGDARVAEFSWERTAQQMLAVYDSVLEKKKP